MGGMNMIKEKNLIFRARFIRKYKKRIKILMRHKKWKVMMTINQNRKIRSH